MFRIVAGAALSAMLLVGGAQAAPITGLLNFAGPAKYNNLGITFQPGTTTTISTGTFAIFPAGTPVIMTSGISLTAFVSGMIDSITLGPHSTNFVATTLVSSLIIPDFINIVLDGVLTFDTTMVPGRMFISGQGPQNVQVSFSDTLNDPFAAPEPATLALLGIGFVGIIAARRQRRT